VRLIAKEIGYNGQIAIVSAASTATNQNAWIAIMKQELARPEYKNMSLVQVAYGNDDDQKSFQETQSLIQAYPGLKAIVSPTSVGIAAAARAIEAAGKSGKVALTGLGTPNLMRKYVKDGAVQAFELWDPSDLGYLAYYTAAALVDGIITGKPGETYVAGKLGSRKIVANSVVTLGPPLVFDKSNIDKFNF
jgi:rhamnose transport system substrate-binding protein